MIASLIVSVATPFALAGTFPVSAVTAGAILAGGITLAAALLATAAFRTPGPAGVWLLALPWAVRFGALAVVAALAAIAVPDLARGLVAAAGTGCIAALLVDLYRQVTARV